jgi:hypothetical protein
LKQTTAGETAMNNNINLMMSMGLIEICGTTFSIIKKNFIFLLKLFLVFIIPLAILIVFSVFEAIKFNEIIQADPNDPKAYVSFFSLITMLVLFGAVNLIYKSSLVITAKRIVLDEYLSLEKIIISSLKSFLFLFLTCLIGNILISLGLLFFILPGIFLIVAFLYIPQVYFIENKNLILNISKSFIMGMKSFITVFLIPIFLYMTYAGSVLLFMSFFSSDFIMKLFTGESIPADKIGYFSKSLSYKSFLISQLAVFFILFYFFFTFVQIAVTLKYLNVKTVEEGRLESNEVKNQGSQ